MDGKNHDGYLLSTPLADNFNSVFKGRRMRNFKILVMQSGNASSVVLNKLDMVSMLAMRSSQQEVY